jgi:dimethylhistidine N-methyltransferase
MLPINVGYLAAFAWRRFYEERLMTKNKQFALDVLKGLLDEKKYLKTHYLYDEYGSEIFNKITKHPDYYLTQCELEILHDNKAEISQLLAQEYFNLIELGPGEGIKSIIIIQQLLKENLNFKYIPVDISKKYLDHLCLKLKRDFKNLDISPLESDFFNLNIPDHNKRKFILFLGSSIGNFNAEESKNFLLNIRKNLSENDLFLIGFDLKKNKDILMRAYNDNDGLTRSFNLNLLTRMNRELQTNFELNNFNHHVSYNNHIEAMESYLVSRKDQNIYSKILDKNFNFKQEEKIHIEISCKYNTEQIAQLAQATGFKIIKNFFDHKKYFVNSLWQACRS